MSSRSTRSRSTRAAARGARFAGAIALVTTALVVAAGPGSAIGTNLLTNGGFESGNFSPGWGFESEGAGTWAVTSTGLSSCTGDQFRPVEGSYDAMWDMADPSGAFLESDPFTIPAGGAVSASVAWDNETNAWTLNGSDPFGLGTSNEWLIVDVIKASADPTSLSPSDILGTLVDQETGTADTFQPFMTFSASLAADAGQSAVFRVATVNTEGCMPVWVDNVWAGVATPSAPTGLAVSQGDGQLTATWLPVANAVSYTCTFLYGFNDPSTFTDTTSSTSCSFGGVTPQDSYGVSVVANGQGGSSAPAVGFMTPAPPPPPPPPVTHSHPVTVCQKGLTAKYKVLNGAHRTCPKGYHRV